VALLHLLVMLRASANSSGSHHFGGQGVSLGMKVVDPFIKLSHGIVCLLAVQAF